MGEDGIMIPGKEQRLDNELQGKEGAMQLYP